MMLNLKKLERTEGAVNAHYEVVHDGGKHKTRLTQDLEVTICERTGAVTGAFHLTELKAASMEEALAKLAVWCDRMATALREPMKVTASVPVFEKDYSREESAQKFELGGLTRVRLLALANGKGVSSVDAFRAAQHLFDAGLITYPRAEVAYLPGENTAVDAILENIEQVFPGVSKGVEARADAPVFLAPYPYHEYAIIPTTDRPSDASAFFQFSDTERVVYRIVAEEFVRAISEPPGGHPPQDTSND